MTPTVSRMDALRKGVTGTAARVLGLLAVLASGTALASEADLILPDFASQSFLGGALNGYQLLLGGVVVCVLGLGFGFLQYGQLKNLPVHKSMLEISELIYETCKTYLITQGKFILGLWVLLLVVMVGYFGVLQHMLSEAPAKLFAILIFSLIGIAGSYGVAWFGIRVNTFANSRTAFASLRGKPYPTYAIPLQAGMSIGMVLISTELLLMLIILLAVPSDFAGPCFIGFAIGESLGASVLRIAGGIFTKIADIGSDLMKIVFKIKEDDARNPGVIADCTGDNAGDSVGPSADGFETYGVTGVALITFILLAVPPAFQVQLLVWIFVMRIVMVVASLLSYFVNEVIQGGKYKNADKMNFEHPLTFLVWLTSFVSVALTFVVSYLLIPDLAGDGSLWWKLSAIITCGTLAGAIIPEAIKAFTSTESRHVREVVTASREGGASLNVISGIVAGNFSAYWMGIIIAGLMAIAYWVSIDVPNTLMLAPAVFAFGLVAFGFLGMGPVTIAVDSYGPVTDNAQSVYELSLIENVPNVKAEVAKDFGFTPDFEKGKEYLEENDGAGNTFKATAKPVLIGTAVVGATTMIFSIIVLLVGTETVNGVLSLKTEGLGNLSLLHAPFLLGLVTGGAVIYWFSGASMQAVSTGAYRAVEFIKANIKLEGVEKASVTDSKRVVEICTQYAQKGMLNIFLGVFFSTLAFACAEPFFFIGYLISIAIFGLYQAVFMANAGGAWDNAKKLVETELRAKGTDLHAATVVGDTVGDPFKDTSSVALNPVIKFTTLFGLLAVELAVELNKSGNGGLTRVLAVVFFLLSLVFVYRSFYGMRIESPVGSESAKTHAKAA
ncbi:sodium-translocating pyrophosphatase [Stigmatella aurantiaca]|uniref:K(+)-insensitive pyrophosphate-energized proton pump n=1 Tax=Stigmatella aurantiaca (strain DW4/3-1) TaxID=378806 RepID=Q08ZE0_STIAD|nr:sodium-translocating pyrophosphatase [Stigmatella aurantiaca]ADO75340.1 Inorganic H+ pyrophosphatase [Stigmatella aurantiaca DW4/3-1]EAU65841.1 pyrophosphate-energized proton pump [Stigmatella aurantiaca DW4/3-1]